MDRSTFIMNLATQGKIAFVSDVGNVNISVNANERPSRTCRSDKLLNDNYSDAEELQLSSSGSEFIPSSYSGDELQSSKNWNDDSSSNSNLSEKEIPLQKNVSVRMEDIYIDNTYLDNIEQNTEKSQSKLSIYNSAANPVPAGVFDNNQLDGNVSEHRPASNDENANIPEIGHGVLTDMNKRHYARQKSSRERPTICPICFNDVKTHFTRHLFRHHPNHKDIKLLKSCKPRSKQRLDMVASLRKQGYFHLNVEKGVLNPVRTSKNPNTEYFTCTFCLGHYSKKLLYKHVKICKNKPVDLTKAGKHCLSKSQTFMASITSKNTEFLKTSRVKAEVFSIMRPDQISFVAKNDPMICLYGETLLTKHKRQQISTVVSNKMREMARLLIAIKSINGDITTLFDVLKPDMFQTLLTATKMISGYNIETKNFKSPSLALHMGTNLKLVCDIAYKVVLEKRHLPNINWADRNEKKMEIKELRKLTVAHWCNELSSLALKNLKENQWNKPVQLPLSSDIQLFNLYLNNRAEEEYKQLTNGQPYISKNYKILAKCVLTLTVMFNRKRIGDVQYLKMETYLKDQQSINQEAFLQSLTAVEQIISKKFKRVVSGGKGSKPVAILFSPRLQKFIACLIKIRTDTNIVPKSNPYLFANPGSENRWMSGTNVIRSLAQDCGVKNSALLTSTKFRKHIATTLQLMSMDENEMEQVATFMGHTKKTHAEFYRLPQDIYQTAKVAKVLLLLEKGRGKEFRGKSLNEIELEKEIYYSSESEPDNKEAVPHADRALRRTINHESDDESDESNDRIKRRDQSTRVIAKPNQGRRRWTEEERNIVLKHFKSHIKNKITPKKKECDELILRHKDILKSKDWIRVKTLVYNSFRQK